MIGPRNSVIAALQGLPYDWLRDTSPFINTRWMRWEELPELWVDKIHDHVGEQSPDY